MTPPRLTMGQALRVAVMVMAALGVTTIGVACIAWNVVSDTGPDNRALLGAFSLAVAASLWAMAYDMHTIFTQETK